MYQLTFKVNQSNYPVVLKFLENYIDVFYTIWEHEGKKLPSEWLLAIVKQNSVDKSPVKEILFYLGVKNSSVSLGWDRTHNSPKGTYFYNFKEKQFKAALQEVVSNLGSFEFNYQILIINKELNEN